MGLGPGCGAIAGGELLADALGITVEELQAALAEARDGLAGQPRPAELLADALGITVDELKAACEAAWEARLAQAVADGRITQEQADMILARRALADYLDRDAIREAIRAIYEDAVQQAVTDGVITQEQADAILSGGGLGMLRGELCGPRNLGGHGVMRGGGCGGPGIFEGKGLGSGGFRGLRGGLGSNGATDSTSGSVTTPASAL